MNKRTIQEDRFHLSKYREYFKIIQDKAGKLINNSEEIIQLKNLFREIPQFKDIPKSSRFDFLNLLRPRTFPQNSLILNAANPNMLILCDGRVAVYPNEDTFRIVKQFNKESV